MPVRIGELLLKEQLITPEQLQQAFGPDPIRWTV